jgi:hypothetical protein
MRNTRKRSGSRRQTSDPAHLSKMAAECVAKLTHLFEECGLERENIARALSQAAEQLIESPPEKPPRSDRASSAKPTHHIFPIANQVVTEWRKNPLFSDDQGKPRLLPTNGPQSMTALVRSVSRSAKVSAVTSYLIGTNTVKRVGARYRLSRPWILVQGKDGSWFQLRYIHQTLSTSINNLRPRSDMARFQRMVEHVRVPISKLPLVERHLERRGMAVLKWFDDLLRRYATERQREERGIWLAVALHLLQGEDGVSLHSAPRVKSDTKITRRDQAQ